MTLRITLLILPVLFWSCRESDTVPFPSLEIEFEEQLVIEPSYSPDKGNFNYAYAVQADSDGQIYIADVEYRSVIIFDPGSNKIGEFGSTGRGPGEFLGIRGFREINDSLWVWDQKQGRLQVFSTDGRLLEIYNPRKVQSSISLYDLQSGFLLLYPDKIGNDNRDRKLGHFFTNGFDTPDESLIVINEVDHKLEDIARTLHGRGPLLSLNSNEFLYVHPYYNGKIYRYRREQGSWKLGQVIEGRFQGEPYELIDEHHPREPSFTYHSIYQNDPLRVLIYSRTLGFAKTDRHILLFTSTEQQETITYGVEVYDLKMNPVGYAPIKNMVYKKDQLNHFRWHVDDFQTDGTLYLREFDREGHRIRVVKISINE